jgi:hypothetical protein
MLPVQSVPPLADQQNLSTEISPQMLYRFEEIGSISKAIESVKGERQSWRNDRHGRIDIIYEIITVSSIFEYR